MRRARLCDARVHRAPEAFNAARFKRGQERRAIPDRRPHEACTVGRGWLVHLSEKVGISLCRLSTDS